jgi:transcriptional regulator with XRE-family HTH domain
LSTVTISIINLFLLRVKIVNTARELIAANIKAKRTELGLTQEKLAVLVDVSYQMVHDIEGCRTWVSDKTLQSLSKALGVEIYELLCPPPTNSANGKKSEFSPHLIERLHKEMKSDIDRRLDKFFGTR